MDPFTAYNAAISIGNAATFGKDLIFGTAKEKNMRVSEPPRHELLVKLTPYLVWFREYSLELIRNFPQKKWISWRFPQDQVGKLLTLKGR